ncbi:MAG: PAS domain S-box protein [Acidobacteria bacterium]|nr:PAS domain S-box protein [Acidobacteriota bacterium]
MADGLSNKSLIIGAAIAVILLVVNVILTLQNTWQLREDVSLVARTHEVTSALTNLQASAIDTQRGLRGFVITGQPTYLKPYHEATAVIDEQVNSVASLTSDDLKQQARIPDLRQRISVVRQNFDHTILLRQNEGFEGARAYIATGQPEAAINSLRGLIAEMISEEEHLLVGRQANSDRTFRVVILTELISGLAALGAIGAFILLLRRYLRSRASAEFTLSEQAERFRTTLASIGDAVITTDTEGRVTNLNQVAESLTGWKDIDAIGESLETVFQIVSETGRQTVENPAFRALREGRIVGLANHTVLIAKDGTEHPIDDSAAPIRCKDGEIVGCVLVFRDVAEQRAASRASAANEARKTAMFETALDCIISIDHMGNIVEFNPAAEQTFGYKSEDVLGLEMAELIIPPKLRDQHRKGMARYLETGTGPVLNRRIELTALRADGQEFPVEFAVTRLPGDGPPLFTGYLRDITLRRKAEKLQSELQADLEERVAQRTSELADQNRFMETLLENIHDGIVACNSEGVLTLFNRATREFHGLPRVAERTKDLQQSEERHRTLVEQIRDYAIFRTDIHGRATTWNEGVERVLGFTEEEFIGQDIVESIFTPEDIRSGVAEQELRIAAVRDSASDDRWMMKKDGTRFFAFGVTTAIRDETGKLIGFSKVMRDQTDRKRLEDELRQVAADLSEADRRKTEFLAMLAHELRSPLAPIRNAMQIFRLKGGEMPDFQPAVDMMQRQVGQMVRLIDDLLDVSRITRGKIELKKQRIELDSVIHHAVEAARPGCESAQHELTVSLADHPIYLDADPARIAQILGNLLNNACKFTEPGGKIDLSVTVDSGYAEIRIKDTGIGVGPEQLPVIFEMFVQADTSLERTQGGLGIGLTLVKRLAEMHGGSVEARSEGTGKGSVFIVRLPLATESAESAVSRVLPDVAGRSGVRRILVVDDNRDSADSLAMLLTLGGHNIVDIARDGIEAVEAAGRLKPDVVLLDIGLPKLNGYEAARRIRAQAGSNGVYLIALTGWGQDEDRRRSSEAGFDAHLVKPVDYEKLSKLLDEVEVN